MPTDKSRGFSEKLNREKDPYPVYVSHSLPACENHFNHGIT
jgi:hypothetical protein